MGLCALLQQTGAMVASCGVGYAAVALDYPPCFQCSDGYGATPSGYCEPCGSVGVLVGLLVVYGVLGHALLVAVPPVVTSRRQQLVVRIAGLLVWVLHSVHVVAQVGRAGPPSTCCCPHVLCSHAVALRAYGRGTDG